jgi:catechol 2,3-dioxygenase-like lactoylglutathione lyase family enzyme
MTIILNHTIVPARDKVAAARFFASIFGLHFNEQQSDHFAPVSVNETLTLLFDEDTSFNTNSISR